jgi:hypothetical protein
MERGKAETRFLNMTLDETFDVTFDASMHVSIPCYLLVLGTLQKR